MQNKKFQILIVDDEEDINEICCDAFEVEGFKVFSACSAELALEIFLRENIDVIISDSMMPGIKGEELFHQIKESGERIPYFFLSTGMIDMDEDAFITQGAAGVISKPFDIGEMINRVREKLTSAA